MNNKIALDSIMPPTEDKSYSRLKLNHFRQTSQFCDVIFKVKLDDLERSFNCHKSILAAASPYFKAMFSDGFKEAHSGEVMIKADPDVFSDILDFIYLQKLQINEENVEKLMIAASMFQIIDLKNLCNKFLESQAEVDNCIANNTEPHENKRLLIKIEKFTGKNFFQISQSEEFKLQPESVISELISKDELHVVCESQVYNAVVEWVKYDVNSRQRLLNKLITNVRCHLIKPEFISKQLKNCEIVRSTCYDYLTKVLKDLKAFIPIESKSRQLDIPQVIYVIKCVPGSDEALVESEEFYLFETDVSFRLP